MLFYFKRMSESFYKSKIVDDAYNYVQWEKFSEIAKKNDVKSGEVQVKFWTELESKNPKIAKLTVISDELMKMIETTKDNYDRLLKINNKDTEVLKMYGGFLSAFTDTAENGQMLIQKATQHDESTNKNLNTAASTESTAQLLSFFDKENSIIQVAGDFDTIGEI
jgi:hypothetical protein